MNHDPPQGDTSTKRRPPAPSAAAALRVLIVDDHADAADLLGELLQLHGHCCTVVYDGPAALRAVEQGLHDLAMIDIDLPQMDGYALAEALRAAPHPPSVLVAVTGFGRPQDVAEILASGFYDHLRKPLSLDTLTGLLARVAARVAAPLARSSATPGACR